MCTGQRTVITTIHQPSSRLYMMLDKLMLLSDGHVMYSGRADQVHEWFAHLGCALPFGVNVADFILDLANGDFSAGAPQGKEGEDGKKHLIEVCCAAECSNRMCRIVGKAV